MIRCKPQTGGREMGVTFTDPEDGLHGDAVAGRGLQRLGSHGHALA